MDGLIPDRSNFDYEEPESEVQEEMPSSENQLRTIFTQQCSETILSWVYDDFDGDGIYEAYVLTTDGTDNNVWLTTTGGVQLAMNAGNAGWDSETPLTAGRYKFMVLTQCEPVPTMYYAKHYLFTVSNGTVYQPDISGQEGIFGHNGQAGYDQLAADEAEYETPVTDAYYSCKWRGYGPDGQIPWENIRYYDFDESSIQFVEKQENAAAEPESPPENSTIPTASEESAASAWPELTDYYWYRNVQSWEVYEFRDDGTFQVYYTEMPLTPSENTQLSQADLVSSGQSGRYDFDGEKLTIYPDDGASYSMDLYDRSRDPYPDDDAAQYVSDYDGSIYFYETDWEPVEIAGILVTDHSYLVRLGKKA